MLTTRYASRGRVRRGFARHEHGAIHFRWAGDGAPLVALHESPRSSLSLLPLIDGLADRRTVLAFDTPGYGHSDPLPAALPVGDDFTAAFAGALDSLGLPRTAFYATHTGAALAAYLALAHPERVSSLLMDGFAAFTRDEATEFLEVYLSPFEPQWDGAHLAHLWSRCKDLYTWFPYNRREPERRLAFDPPPPTKIHDTVLGFLMAGAGYVKGYRCAALIDPAAAVATLRVPTTITARPHDLIHAHLERVTPTDFVRVERIGPSVDEWLTAIDRASPPVGAAPSLGGALRARARGGWDRVLVELGQGYLHAVDRGSGDEADVVIPDIPDTALRVAHALGTTGRRVIVVDPPGCGASDPAAAQTDALVEHAVQALRAALDALGVRRGRVLGLGLGGVLAERLAAADPRFARAHAMQLPAWARGAAPVPEHAVVPAATRDPDGASLFTSWYRLRDRFLYDDAGALEPKQRTARRDAPTPDEVNDRHAALWIAPECASLAAEIQQRVRAEPQWHRRTTLLDGELRADVLDSLDAAAHAT
jgi:pimeloyl-ACP methyl ester carboxylesterase